MIGAHPFAQVEIHLIEEHDGVLDHHSRQTHGTEQRHEAEWRTSYEQPQRDPDHGERDYREDDDGRAEGIEERDDDEGHDHNGRDQAWDQPAERFLLRRELAVPLECEPRRQLDRFELRDHHRPQLRQRGVVRRGLNRNGAPPVPAVDSGVLPANPDSARHRGQGNCVGRHARADLELIKGRRSARAFLADVAKHDRYQVVALAIEAREDAVVRPLRRHGHVLARDAGPPSPLLDVLGNQLAGSLAPVAPGLLGKWSRVQDRHSLSCQAAEGVWLRVGGAAEARLERPVVPRTDAVLPHAH